ncbi:uncharacterized protein LOC131322945 [Rhododendron vialii]|uniref:uncharacterized protein LOC131322945 n=1 Tax=Rhododendron vialii TaxID=182163 RepID=UPI00265FACE9|nr:uncharacterized protein LOC131322945 [Rhododendron vialii]
MLAAMRRNMKKSPRVADETMFGVRNGPESPIFGNGMDRRRSRWKGFSVICSVLRAPLSLVSCLSQPRISAADGVWVSCELTRVSEMNHLMVNDSLRYAILM